MYLYQLTSYVYPGQGVVFLFFRPMMGVLYAFSKGWLWPNPLVLSLGELWLNGIVQCTLFGFLTLRLVFRAPRGRSLGHMTPYLISTQVTAFHSEALASSFSHLQAPLLASFQHNALSPWGLLNDDVIIASKLSRLFEWEY